MRFELNLLDNMPTSLRPGNISLTDDKLGADSKKGLAIALNNKLT